MMPPPSLSSGLPPCPSSPSPRGSTTTARTSRRPSSSSSPPQGRHLGGRRGRKTGSSLLLPSLVSGLAAWGVLSQAATAATSSIDATSTTSNNNMMIQSHQVYAQPKRAMPPHRRRRRYLVNQHQHQSHDEDLHNLDTSDAGDEVPVHTGYGTHYSFIYVGTPPQRVSVILDTGSHMTAFPCTGCSECGNTHTDAYFSNEKSSSFQPVLCGECVLNKSHHCQNFRCPISLSYVEGSSWEGYEARDLVFLGGDSVNRSSPSLATPFVFGCQTHEAGLFQSQLEDGIMGLALYEPTIVPRLKKDKKIAESIFALCLTMDGGSFTVGGYDGRQHIGPIQYLPLTKTYGFYTVRLAEVKVGNVTVEISPDEYNKGSGTIVDSGTTDTSLPISAAEPFIKAFSLATQGRYLVYSTTNAIGTITMAEAHTLPDVVFVFEGGLELTFPATKYLDCPPQGGVGMYCTGALTFEGNVGVVLGANFMRDIDVIFDNEHQRIGFAASQCSDGTQGFNGATHAQQVPAAVIKKGEDGGGGRRSRRLRK